MVEASTAHRSGARLEDRRLLTGRGIFADDVAPAGSLSVVFLRSPHAHAAIAQIDVRSAAAMPGVAGVYIGADAADLGPLPTRGTITGADGKRSLAPTRPVIARDRVRHVGEIVAMVAAATAELARDAAEMIAVSYVPLAATVDARTALALEAPQLHEDIPRNRACLFEAGDRDRTERAFASAHRIERLSSRLNRIAAAYIEPRSAWADYDSASDCVTLTTPSQGVHALRDVLCESVLKIPPERLRVVTGDVGGGFGPKYNLYPEQALLSWAAFRLRRAVRWSGERSEHFMADAQARDMSAEIALALDDAGNFLGLRIEAFTNLGAYASTLSAMIPTNGMEKAISSLYRIPTIHIAMECVYTNTVPVDAIRGAGKPETLFLVERVVDLAAAQRREDPATLRRRNLLHPADFPYSTATGHSIDPCDCPALLDEALRRADRVGFEQRRARSQERGRYRGFGIACHLHITGGSGDEQARVTLRGDGVDAVTGTQSQGQGHETAYARLVASQLGLASEHITLLQGDTARSGRGGGTGGSSSTIISGTTLHRATKVLIARARDFAAERLEAASVDLALREGAFEVIGTDRRIALVELGRLAHEAGTPLSGEAAFTGSFESTPVGIAICEVEIDPEIGHCEILRFVEMFDAGRVIDPTLIRGQIQGGLAMGIGNALLEEILYDPESGQLLTGTFLDYGVPRAEHLPYFEIGWAETPAPRNEMGVKGVGELPTNGAPAAVANAVLDALAPLGIAHLDMPFSPEKVWRAINEARKAATA